MAEPEWPGIMGESNPEPGFDTFGGGEQRSEQFLMSPSNETTSYYDIFKYNRIRKQILKNLPQDEQVALTNILEELPQDERVALVNALRDLPHDKQVALTNILKALPQDERVALTNILKDLPDVQGLDPNAHAREFLMDTGAFVNVLENLSDNERGILINVMDNFSPTERLALMRLQWQICRKYVNLKIEDKEQLIFHPTDEQVKASLEGKERKNMLVMCGGGKDSEVTLAGARTLQLLTKGKYDGATFELRVGIGRQPGMIDVYDNLENAFNALGLIDEPFADLFYIDNKVTKPYHKDTPIPREVRDLYREDVLLNGHKFSGAGRRSFCDSCNRGLAGWIATGLAYKGKDNHKADLYMTGDSPTELREQSGTAIPKAMKTFGVERPVLEDRASDVIRAFLDMETAFHEYTTRTHTDPAKINARSIDWHNIDPKSKHVSFFSVMKYESRDRLPFLTNFLKFNFDSLMFSFTESDCGNPALMCHLYGLIAEHCLGTRGATYNDGVRMYVEYALGKMREKGFPEPLIEQMKERYGDDTRINEIRTRVEKYANRAYGFEPENLIAIVLAPFTDEGKYLKRYLNYLVESDKPDGHSLRAAEPKIRAMLESKSPLSADQEPLARRLEELTALNIEQMRQMYHTELLWDPCDEKHRNSPREEVLKEAVASDTLYTGKGIIRPEGREIIPLTIFGR